MKQNCTSDPNILSTDENEEMKQERGKDIISHSEPDSTLKRDKRN
jgi:hypothetical protein